MKIEKGKLVSVDYSLYTDGPDGELVEETTAEEPFDFIFGHEAMLDGFETALRDKAAGESFSVLIKSDDAYGPESEEAIITMEKSAFVVDGELDEEMLQPGEIIPLEDEEGNELMGLVVSNEADKVIIDLNHPLAGLDLYFDGEVLDVREPTKEEWSRLEEE